MSELTLKEKLRSAHVKRWQIVNVSRTQTVAEHSFLVQLIAIDLSRAIKYTNAHGGPLNIEKEHQIIQWAMWHDLMEVKTGDIATPVKLKMKAMGAGAVIEEIERDISGEYSSIKKKTFGPVFLIVKLADYLEAAGFLKEEGKGEHAAEVLQLLREQTREHFKKCKAEFPSFKWDGALPILAAALGD